MADRKIILTEADILQEEELVAEIKTAEPGQPMTADQFTEWLNRFPNN